MNEVPDEVVRAMTYSDCRSAQEQPGGPLSGSDAELSAVSGVSQTIGE